MIGPTLEFTDGTLIAITGGDFQPVINGEPAPMYTAIDVHKGDVLKFGSARTGSRGYIAFSSYLKIPVVMGSRCTNMKSSIGGFKGRKLQDGDYIGFRIKRRYLPFFLSRTLELDEFNQEDVTLRVVLGPQEDRFSRQGIKTFLTSEYVVTSDFDRMGCRLDGPFIAPKDTSDIISDGIAFGSIQVPSHGKPIILLADSLYASGPVMETCRGNGWEYIIRYKTGSIPSITEEYENIPEKGKTGHAEFVNDIDYNGKKVNMLRFWEEKVEKGETVRTEFQADKHKADRGECGESGAGGKGSAGR